MVTISNVIICLVCCTGILFSVQGAAKKTYHDKNLIFSQTDRKFKTKFSTLIPNIIICPYFDKVLLKNFNESNDAVNLK